MPFSFGPFFLDDADRNLLEDGRPVEVQPQVFDLLALLGDGPKTF